MSAFLIIPLLVSGFLIITRDPYHFYRLHRYDGQLLYMKAAGYGFFCMMCVIFIGLAIRFAFPHFHPVYILSEAANFSVKADENRFDSWIILISTGTLFLSFVWGYWSKFRYLIRFIRAAIKGRYSCDMKSLPTLWRLSVLEPIFAEHPLNRMFFESLTGKKPMLISLKCGKVYVGIVSKISEPNECEAPSQEISLVPAMSGYRDSADKRVRLINDYSNLNGVDSSIAIPCAEIIRASWFTKSVHDLVDNNCNI